MEHTKLLALFICFVIGFLGGLGWSIWCYANSPQVCYTGALTFNTTQEYNEFKQFILQPQVEIDEISAVDSQPPIWVKYAVLVPRGFNFSYPHTSSSNVPTTSFIFPATLLTVLSTAGAVVTGRELIGKLAGRQNES